MKFFAVLSALVALGLADEAAVIAPYAAYAGYPYAGYGYAGYAHHPYAHIPNTGSQFHAQDEFGNLNYGYSNLNSVKQEVGNTYGGVNGGYSYVDANGVLQTVRYIADGLGFRVEDSRLGVAPEFNPEPLVAPTFNPEPLVAPVDTPEVAAAKAEHAAAHAAIAKRSADAAVVDGHSAILTAPTPFIHNPPIRPTIALPAVAAYHGLGHAGLGYHGLGHAGLGYAGLGYGGLGYGLGHAIGKRSADAAVVDGHSAILTAPTPFIHNPPIRPTVALPAVHAGYHGLGYGGLGYAGLGYGGLGYGGLGYGGLGYGLGLGHGLLAAPAVL